MAQNEQLTNTEFYTNKDPESQDVLDQDEGLNGGDEGGSNFWIYALVGVLLIGGIIVLIVCLSGKKSKATTTTYKFDVPAEGELSTADTQKFVKALYDYKTANYVKSAALVKNFGEATKLYATKPEEAAKEIKKLLDESEQLTKDILALIEQATPYADRLAKEEINGVKSPQESVKNYLKAGKDAAELGKAELETSEALLKAKADIKDPKKPTAEELKAIADLVAKLQTDQDQSVSKLHAVTQAEADIKKLFPAEKPADKKPTDKDAKPADK